MTFFVGFGFVVVSTGAAVVSSITGSVVTGATDTGGAPTESFSFSLAPASPQPAVTISAVTAATRLMRFFIDADLPP
nr:hypothetical protein Aca09nite_18020 [Actinoplanes campanulatus]